MHPIEVLYVKVENNFCSIDSLFIFEVLYEVKMILKEDFEVSVIYITSPLEKNCDQELELFRLPAKKIGKFKVLLKVRPPNYENIEWEELTEVTIILLVISYQNKELIRIGYYLNNEFNHNDKINSKDSNRTHSVLRKILSDRPRITYFPFISNQD
nr:ASF1-like histone chaperone [Cryptomonas sp.]